MVATGRRKKSMMAAGEKRKTIDSECEHQSLPTKKKMMHKPQLGGCTVDDKAHRTTFIAAELSQSKLRTSLDVLGQGRRRTSWQENDQEEPYDGKKLAYKEKDNRR